jgi:metal-responsive CopG/Arc/MetJ family transcriptional regulator
VRIVCFLTDGYIGNDMARRVNITLPERLLVQIDSFAARQEGSRSGLLAHAAMEYVAAHEQR